MLPRAEVVVVVVGTAGQGVQSCDERSIFGFPLGREKGLWLCLLFEVKDSLILRLPACMSRLGSFGGDVKASAPSTSAHSHSIDRIATVLTLANELLAAGLGSTSQKV